MGDAIGGERTPTARRLEGGDREDPATAASGLQWLTNTCHIWSVDGIGMQKLTAGWKPGNGEYPAPSLVEIRGRRGARPPGPDQE